MVVPQQYFQLWCDSCGCCPREVHRGGGLTETLIVSSIRYAIANLFACPNLWHFRVAGVLEGINLPSWPLISFMTNTWYVTLFLFFLLDLSFFCFFPPSSIVVGVSNRFTTYTFLYTLKLFLSFTFCKDETIIDFVPLNSLLFGCI